MVEKARQIASAALKDELRSNGVPFISHPDGVASIVRDEIGLPDECVAAVYLHEASRTHPDVDMSEFPAEVPRTADGGSYRLRPICPCGWRCPLSSACRRRLG